MSDGWEECVCDSMAQPTAIYFASCSCSCSSMKSESLIIITTVESKESFDSPLTEKNERELILE